MPSSSSPSPLELTPPATSYRPSSAVDADADDDEDPYIPTPESDTDSNSGFVAAGEGGYELRPLSQSARDREDVYADEHGTLIAPEHDSSGDEEGGARGGAVVYDASDDEGLSSHTRRRQRRRPRMRKEFLYTREEEGKVVRKFDIYLVGFLASLYMLSFLDRSNIGNAKVAGMNKDLGLTGAQYEWLLIAFYLTYISFEWMTLCYKVFAAHKYIACCVMGWGFVASMQGLATNWWYMLFFRALLGITEAAFGPGIPFYLSFFYRREELALRCGLFISAAPLATAYAGFLAYALTSIPSAIAPWRLLFILEGFPSMIAAVFAYYIIPDLPSDARFLTTDEKKIARRRLLVVTEEGEHSAAAMREEEDHQSGVRWGEVFAALRDSGNWIVALMYFFCNVSFSSLPVFLPTIINDMGYTSTTAQALSAPPYLFAFVLVLLSTWISDRYTTRSIPIILCCLLGAVGYALLAGTGSLQSSLSSALAGVESIEASGPGRWWETYVSEAQWVKSETVGVGVKYTGVFMAAGGIFSAIALVMVWVVNNGESESGRGAGIGLVQIIGQCGPLLGTRLYPPEDGPYYVRGMSTCCGALVMVCVLAYLQRWRLKKKNLQRERKNLLEGRPREIGFRFIL